MAKLSLLDMVQDILSDMNDDEVNSISDTVESLQVAQIIKSVYFELIDSRTWPHLQSLFKLEASATTSRPTHMKVPENVREVERVEYNKKQEASGRTLFSEVAYVTPDEFLRRTAAYNSSQSTVQSVTDLSGVSFLIKNDKQPEFWTSFDDEWIVFNAFNSDIEATLISSNSRALGYIDPSWQMEDEFVPDLPSEAFSYLLAESKSTAFARIKQADDAKAEQQSRRQRHQMHKSVRKVDAQVKTVSYPRRSRK